MAENFKLPSEEEFEFVCENLGLNSKQSGELREVIHRTYERVGGIVRSNIGSAGRKRVMDDLGALDRVLRELIKALGIKSHEISSFAHGDILDLANVRASGRLTQAIAGRRVARAMHDPSYSSPAFDALLFVPQLVALKKEMDALLQQVPRDRGGPNQDLARTYLIAELIKAEKRILGSAATGTEHGPFMNLVSNVFGICGLKERGVRSLVQRSLRAVRRAG